MKPRRTYLAFLILFISITLLLTGCNKLNRKGTLQPIKTYANLTTGQKVTMFALVRKALAYYPDMEKALALPTESDLPEICDREIFVTVFYEGSPQITGVGTQGCTQKRLLRAVVNLTNNPEFKKKYILNLRSIGIKIDLVMTRRPLNFDRPLKKIVVEPGIHGLILQDGEKITYQLPTDFIHFAWEPQERSGNLRVQRLKTQLKYLGRQAGLASDAYKEFPIYRFRTQSYFQPLPDLMPQPLYRGQMLSVNFNAADMARGAAGGGDWLIHNIHPTGRFTYKFNPETGKQNNFLDYNIVRHAGCVYALLHLYNQSLEPRYLERGLASLEFLQRNLGPPLLEQGLLAVKHPLTGVQKLGTTALTLLALCELPETQFDKIGIQTTNRLADFLLKMQLSDGTFYSNYLQKLSGIQPGRPPRYSSGEALLALVRYYKKNPNVDWLEGAKSAADRLIDHFDQTEQFDGWVVQGLSELYRIDPDPRYSQAVFDMAELLLESQYKDHKYKDYIGGFNNTRPPRTAPAASRTEALIAASDLCYFQGNDCKKYDDAILLAARYLLWNQYRRETSYFVHLFDSVEGAFRGGTADPTIRMDYTQHAIAALTGAYRIANQIEEAKKATFEAEAETQK